MTYTPWTLSNTVDPGDIASETSIVDASKGNLATGSGDGVGERGSQVDTDHVLCKGGGVLEDVQDGNGASWCIVPQTHDAVNRGWEG